MEAETSTTRISRQSFRRAVRVLNTGRSGTTSTRPSSRRRMCARLARSVRGRSRGPPGRRVGRGVVRPVRVGRRRVASSLVSSSTSRFTSGRRLATRCSGIPLARVSTADSSSTEGRTEAGSSRAMTSVRPSATARSRTSCRISAPNSVRRSSAQCRTLGKLRAAPPVRSSSLPSEVPPAPGSGSPPSPPSFVSRLSSSASSPSRSKSSSSARAYGRRAAGSPAVSRPSSSRQRSAGPSRGAPAPCGTSAPEGAVRGAGADVAPASFAAGALARSARPSSPSRAKPSPSAAAHRPTSSAGAGSRRSGRSPRRSETAARTRLRPCGVSARKPPRRAYSRSRKPRSLMVSTRSNSGPRAVDADSIRKPAATSTPVSRRSSRRRPSGPVAVSTQPASLVPSRSEPSRSSSTRAAWAAPWRSGEPRRESAYSSPSSRRPSRSAALRTARVTTATASRGSSLPASPGRRRTAASSRRPASRAARIRTVSVVPGRCRRRTESNRSRAARSSGSAAAPGRTRSASVRPSWSRSVRAHRAAAPRRATTRAEVTRPASAALRWFSRRVPSAAWAAVTPRTPTRSRRAATDGVHAARHRVVSALPSPAPVTSTGSA